MSALKNYSTEIPARKSFLEMQEMLYKHGVKAVLTEFDDQREPVALSFSIHAAHGQMSYRLAANVTGVLAVLRDQARQGLLQPRFTKPEHAEQVAWRVMKDWLASNLALIEIGMARMEEVLLPYLILDSGETLYRRLEAEGFDVQPQRLFLPEARRDREA